MIGTWKYGLLYQCWNQNYRVSTEVLPSSYSVKLDLRGLPSNVGRVLQEDASGCRVTVDSVEQDGEYYRVVFQAEGVCPLPAAGWSPAATISAGTSTLTGLSSPPLCPAPLAARHTALAAII